MGRATRWLRSLFGIKREREREKQNPNPSSALCHNPATIPPNISPAEAAWLQSFYSETDKEQNKHAIAVAAATAAAADAAVAAAQAAVAVVRLTSHGRDSMFAAVKIQTVFRGYLARKALRALKGLVKLQALVRGYLVRKQATATLRGMQALIRAQATVRSHKYSEARRSMERYEEIRPIIHSRRLSSSFDATVIGSPKIVEIDTGRPKSRSRRSNTSISDFGDDPSHPSPAHLSIPTNHNYNHSDWGAFSTPQTTPRFSNSCTCATPKSLFSYNSTTFFDRECPGFPNYMANTQSFKAKLRSHSAPKQRPDPASKKRLSLNQVMESRNSLSGVRMHNTCSKIQEAINFKNAVMGKLDRETQRRF